MTLAEVAYPMSRRDREKQRSRSRALRKGLENAAKRGDGGATVKASAAVPPVRGGLDWLLAKKKITPLQAFAGRRYGRDYRICATAGLEPLRSCLSDNIGGGGVVGFPLARDDIDARTALLDAREALAFQSDLVAVCDLICGRELTPWDVVRLNGGTQRDAEEIVTTVRIALDILGAHYRNRVAP